MKARSKSSLRMPPSRMTQILKTSLVFLRELEPNSWLSFIESKISFWISSLLSSEAILQGGRLRRQSPADLHGGHILLIYSTYFLLLFSVALPLLMPVYFNLQSMHVMYLGRYWRVSNNSFSEAKSSRKWETKMLSLFQIELL